MMANKRPSASRKFKMPSHLLTLTCLLEACWDNCKGGRRLLSLLVIVRILFCVFAFITEPGRGNQGRRKPEKGAHGLSVAEIN